MTNELLKVKTPEDLKKCYPLLCELRPHLGWEDYLSIYECAHRQDGYEMMMLQREGEALALIGYRTLYDFVRGKHLYIDDLIATEKARSQGLGAELLRYAENVARETGCRSLRLCTGIDNARGMKFYEKNSWTQRAYAYVKKLNT